MGIEIVRGIEASSMVRVPIAETVLRLWSTLVLGRAVNHVQTYLFITMLFPNLVALGKAVELI